MFEHDDLLKELNRNIPIGAKLGHVHRVLRERFTSIDRVAVALYDAKTDILKTFVDSSGSGHPLAHYQSRLTDSESLREILRCGRPRVVDDLDIYAHITHVHAQRIREHGYRSSYTLPMYLDGAFFGFVFFNSRELNAFAPDTLHYLDVFAHLITLVIVNEMSAVHTLLAALKTARVMTHQRDPETGAHLDRMSRYAQLIARDLADEYGFDDELIEHIFLFAPLHDIGKIGVPDSILLKPGTLTETEFLKMRGHAQKGREIIDDMLKNFGLEGFQHVDILRNIVQHHHESLDGNGYPAGLRGTEIPIEARIVAVADVFDAFTSRRPYKEPWPNDQAFAALRHLAGIKLDPRCVAALEKQRATVEEIQTRFVEDRYG